MRDLAKQVTLISLALTLAVGCNQDRDGPATSTTVGSMPTSDADQEPGGYNVQSNSTKQAYFGDLHVHTAYSLDAYQNGNRIPPRDAYRFARGERIQLPSGIEAQLSIPLDFAAITDHAEGLDVIAICTNQQDPQFATKTCQDFRTPEDREYFRAAFARGVERPAQRYPVICENASVCDRAALGPWQDLQEVAEEFNEPGTFTTFNGFEFSPLLPDFGMLHRNVIFRGTSVTHRAISSAHVSDTADFFAQLDEACRGDCEAITIPHNMNFSWGLTFSRLDESGDDYTDLDLQRRIRFDRVAEIFQQKGASECALGVGTTDEACSFEQIFPQCEDSNSTRCAKAGSFARNALKDGLALAHDGSVNPYQFGFIGSTDTHTSDPGNTATTARFPEAYGAKPRAEAILNATHPVIGAMRVTNPGGLAGVWATSNTRDAIFDALKRRETFATSGTRLRVRFFAGDLPTDLGQHSSPLAAVEAAGVPMGSEIHASSSPPRFWVWATRAPDGATLDRIEIVKASYRNAHQEAIWDVACSAGRDADPESGRCAPTPAGVDTETCEIRDESGATELQATFLDPTFDPSEHALYYVRVYENPTCRWTTMLARSAGLEPPTDQPAVIQERAWTSPIWYSPAPD